MNYNCHHYFRVHLLTLIWDDLKISVTLLIGWKLQHAKNLHFTKKQLRVEGKVVMLVYEEFYTREIYY